VVAAVAACRSGSSSIPEARADETASKGAAGVAVVELFTSEGCSSCPPADQVLADLAQRGVASVYALAFHVDYWDDLGWRDRFALPDSTARQQAYSRAFRSTGLYTPQMIVGGAEQFTGSDRAHAEAAVERALAHPLSVKLSVHAQRTGTNPVRVDYEAPGAPPGCVLIAAVVERSASTSVGAGENVGKTLHHANVVRAFREVGVSSASGTIIVPLPPSLSLEGTELIAYVQHPATEGGGRPILGAARSPLPH
jgi:hypothetical protein